MAKTFKKITYSLLEIATNFAITDDVEYPLKWVEDEVISLHNTLMREAYVNNQLGPELLQIHKNVEIDSLTEDIMFDDVPVKLRSELCYAKIPELVSGIGQRNIDYLGGVDLGTPYSYRILSVLLNDDGVLYKLPTPAYSIVGNKVILRKNAIGGARMISIIGYFRDPRDVNTYNEDDPFQTPSEYKLEMLCLKHLFSSKGVQPDLISDAQRAYNQPQPQPSESD